MTGASQRALLGAEAGGSARTASPASQRWPKAGMHLFAVFGSLAIHSGVALAVAAVVRPAPTGSGALMLSLKRSPPRSAEPLAPPPVAEAPRRADPAAPRLRPARPPAPRRASPKPPPAPPPVFGLSAEALTVQDAAVAVPATDPTPAAVRGPAAAPGSAGQESSGSALSGDHAILRPPSVDAKACGHTIAYPSEAEQLGIEGDVTLRLSVDERGRVREARVLSGPGHGLDDAARHALQDLCQFTPAIATDGHPVPYVIRAYVFHFEIPR